MKLSCQSNVALLKPLMAVKLHKPVLLLDAHPPDATSVIVLEHVHQLKKPPPGHFAAEPRYSKSALIYNKLEAAIGRSYSKNIKAAARYVTGTTDSMNILLCTVQLLGPYHNLATYIGARGSLVQRLVHYCPCPFHPNITPSPTPQVTVRIPDICIFTCRTWSDPSCQDHL